MDKLEFYLNQSLNHECFKLPERDKKYLLKNNYLNEYFSDEEKAQVRSNLGITPLLDELREFILAKMFDEEGNILFDIEPHEDAYDRVLSSAIIYRILLRYYTKEELDNQSETIFNLINEKANKNDTYTKELIDEIVYGSTFVNRLESIINSKIQQVVENIPSKVSQLENDSEYITQENLSNYITLDDIAEIRDAILQEFSSYISGYLEALVSGLNIKTINGESILGSGDIVLQTEGNTNLTPYIKNGTWWVGDEDTGVPALGTAGNSPYIGEDGYWYINGVKTDYRVEQDSTPGDDGQTPYIKNGTWWIGDYNTNVPVSGQNGENGLTPYIKDNAWYIGDTKIQDISNGIDGLTPYIKNGTWWIGNEDTGVLAEGTAGNSPYIGDDGYWYVNGVKTEYHIPEDGTPGTDGQTPYIKNGTWWIGDFDTGVRVTGQDGQNGQDGLDRLTPYIKDGAWYIGDTKILDIPSYQEILVSGENIKTINGLSILGSGDITINSSNPITVDSETSTDSQNPVQNKAITSYIAQEISRLEQLLSNYQETLVNLSNIKSINNKSLLGSGNMLLYKVLTQEQYDSLDNVSKDTLYLIVEPDNWGFGDNFPVILS